MAATSTENANGDTATTNETIDVTITAVADAPTLAVADASGNEDTPISLTIGASLVDADGSETIRSLEVGAIPVGATITDGTNSFTATSGNTSVDIVTWNLNSLSITPVEHSDANFTLTVAATSTENANGDTATTNEEIEVTIVAVADAPTLAVADASGNEDTPIALTIGAALVDADGSEAISSLEIGAIPIGATITDGANDFTATSGNTSVNIASWNLNSLSITAPEHSDANFTLTVAATSTENANGNTATTNETITVTLTAVADAPTLAVADASGNEDTSIPLTIGAALVDADGSETITSLEVGAIPVGATITDGTNSFTATSGNTSIDIVAWNLNSLSLTPVEHSDASFTLTVTATSSESANGDTATTNETITVTITAISDTPTLAVADASGNEDTPIALTIGAALVDADGSEALSSLEVGAIPVGATITDGTNSFTATSGNTSVNIASWNLNSLSITPVEHSDVDFTLTVAATSTENANGDTATTNETIAVTITAVADAPTLAVADASGNEDTPIALTIGAALVDADGSEAISSLEIGAIPVGATISDGTNSFTATSGNTSIDIITWNLNSLSLTPVEHSDSDFTLTVAATSTENANGDTATTNETIAVTITAVADAPTLAVADASGNEDTPIPLTIGAALVDADGSEAISSLEVGAIPVGATITDGTNSFTATSGNTSVDIVTWNLNSLSLTPVEHSDANFTLTVAATSTENANGDTATTNETIAVTLTAVADAPTLAVADASGHEDTPIALTIGAALVDADGSEAISSLEVGAIPVGATITDGTNSFTATSGNTSIDILTWNLNSLSLTPVEHSDSDFTLTVTATSTENANGDTANSNKTIAVTITAVADAPTLAVADASGNEDTPIPLTIGATLVDADGSEAISALEVGAIPVGATITDGTNSFTATAGNTSVNIASWNLNSLSITPVEHSDANFTLTVAATSTENTNGDTATTNETIDVTLTAVADAPSLAVSNATGNEDTPIAVTIGATLVDADGSEVISSLEVGDIPVGVTITDGNNSFTATSGNTSVDLLDWNLNALSLTLVEHDASNFTLSVAATSTENANGDVAVTNAAIEVTVIPVADAPTLATADASGLEDTAIPLTIGALLVDADGSEVLSALLLEGLPIGSLLSDGTNSFEASSGDTSVDILTWNISQLTITPPENDTSDINLQVTAFSTENENGDTASTPGDILVTITPVNDAPTITSPNIVTTNEDEPFNFGSTISIADVDLGDQRATLTLSAENGVLRLANSAFLLDPAGNNNNLMSIEGTAAQLNAALNNLRFIPDSNYSGPAVVHILVTDNAENAETATTAITLNVKPVVDAPEITTANAFGSINAIFPLRINPSLVDRDGSERLSLLEISNIPRGAIISDGLNTFRAGGENDTVEITDWNLNRLRFKPPANVADFFDLSVRVESMEKETGETASRLAELRIQTNQIGGDAEPVNPIEVAEDGSVRLNPQNNGSDTQTFNRDGSLVQITSSVQPVLPENQQEAYVPDPVNFQLISDDVEVKVTQTARKGELTFNTDGSFTYLPRAGEVGTDAFNFEVRLGNEEVKNVNVIVQIAAPQATVEQGFHAPEVFNLAKNLAYGALTFNTNVTNVTTAPMSAQIFIRHDEVETPNIHLPSANLDEPAAPATHTVAAFAINTDPLDLPTANESTNRANSHQGLVADALQALKGKETTPVSDADKELLEKAAEQSKEKDPDDKGAILKK